MWSRTSGSSASGATRRRGRGIPSPPWGCGSGGEAGTSGRTSRSRSSAFWTKEELEEHLEWLAGSCDNISKHPLSGAHAEVATEAKDVVRATAKSRLGKVTSGHLSDVDFPEANLPTLQKVLCRMGLVWSMSDEIETWTHDIAIRKQQL